MYDVFCEMMDKHFRRVEPIDVALGREPDVDEIHEYKKPEYKALLTSRRLINRAEIENFRKLLDSLT